MKKTILLFGVALVICAPSFAQKGDAKAAVPEAIKSSFSQKFPKATAVEWEMEGKDEWEAEFKLDGKEFSASFSSAGAWIETESEIKKANLPAAITKALDVEFAGYKLVEAETIETPKLKGYELELKSGEQSIEVVMDESGKLLGRTPASESSDSKGSKSSEDSDEEKK